MMRSNIPYLLNWWPSSGRTFLRQLFTHRAAQLTIAVIVSLWLLDRAFPFRVNVAYSTQVLAADSTLLHAYLNPQDKWRLEARSDEITPLLKRTLLYKEDRYFYYHPGVNPLAVGRAAFNNLLGGRRTSGASTLSMQVVRLLQPRRRTYGNKLIEMIRAIQLDWHYSKDEILQLYLNLVPYGGNIEGIKAASLLYFGKSPELLSLAEITALTIIPNRPNSLRPGSVNTPLLQERNRWLRRFGAAGLVAPNVVEDALQEPFVGRRREAPKAAPHLAGRLKGQFPNQSTLYTTLRPNAQAQAETLVSGYINRLKSQRIQNAAVLILDNETMEVVAYVGSADFENVFDAGQVDGVRAVRSPGSTLKPLLYAVAFDKGILTPKSQLNDVPTNFGGYEPENYDLHFNGPVTVEYALANSLNIPAVKVLKELSTATFVNQLKRAHFMTVHKQAQDLGLSMILGGCGVTLEELTRLFSAFTQKGQLYPIRWLREGKENSQKIQKGEAIVSEEAAFLITNVLTQVTRPDLPTQFDNTYHLPRIAWKTGTSYGKRDAWSIGYNRRYTIGVWVGNFSGEGVPELSGANTATPLLFDLFNTLDYNAPKGWFLAPDQVSLRKVCAVSGMIPDEFCTHQIADYYIMGVSPYKRCTHRKWVFTNPEETYSYCGACMPATPTVKRHYPNLAPELLAFYEAKKIPYERIPPHYPGCERVFRQGAPLIVSPNANSEYYVQADEQIQLLCQPANDVKEVFWYVNDKLVARSDPHTGVFVRLPLGKIKISCSDDKGRNTDIAISLKKV